MKRALLALIPALAGLGVLSSCNLLEESAQYIAPFATEIILVNVPEMDVGGTKIPAMVTATVALGKLSDPETPGSSPFSAETVAGAVVTITSAEGTFNLKEDASLPGAYVLTNLEEANFKYTEGAEYKVTITVNNQEYWAKFVAAAGITLTNPAEFGAYQAPGTDLNVTWDPATDNGLVYVFDSSGTGVYDNVPKDLNTIYTFLVQENISSLLVPGATFEEEQAYGLAVAGLTRSPVDVDHFSTNLNHLVSNAVTGNAVLTAVTTIDIPEVPARP